MNFWTVNLLKYSSELTVNDFFILVWNLIEIYYISLSYRLYITPKIPTTTSTISAHTIPPAIAPVFEFSFFGSLFIGSEKIYSFYQMNALSQNNILKCFLFFSCYLSHKESNKNVYINKTNSFYEYFKVLIHCFKISAKQFYFILLDFCKTVSFLCYALRNLN